MATIHIGSLDKKPVEAKVSQTAMDKAAEIAASLDKPIRDLVALHEILMTDDLEDAQYIRQMLGKVEDVKKELEVWANLAAVDFAESESDDCGESMEPAEAVLDIVNDENIFEVTEALYAWLMHNHEGQSSDHYEKLCQLPFEPGPMWSDSQVENENIHYQEINEENYEKYFDEINEFLDRAESATTVSL